jgi:hypothetical protein
MPELPLPATVSMLPFDSTYRTRSLPESAI